MNVMCLRGCGRFGAASRLGDCRKCVDDGGFVAWLTPNRRRFKTEYDNARPPRIVPLVPLTVARDVLCVLSYPPGGQVAPEHTLKNSHAFSSPPPEKINVATVICGRHSGLAGQPRISSPISGRAIDARLTSKSTHLLQTRISVTQGSPREQ